MTPAQRALAITRAKAVCFRFVTAVRAGDARMVQAVCDGLSPQELAALAIVLAEVADVQRLKIVQGVPDDGTPASYQRKAG